MGKDGTVCFSAEGMLKHYEQFDPVRFKYDIPHIAECLLSDDSQHGAENLTDLFEQELFTIEDMRALIPEIRTAEDAVSAILAQPPDQRIQICKPLLDRRLTNYLRHYEASNNLASLTKRDFSHIMENLYMIYHENEKTILGYAQMLDLVSKRLVNEYVGIDGLERLFSDQYIDFEWEMHLGMDHFRHTMDFYRDHFLHQIRDAHMLEMLLSEDKLYRNVRDVLMQPSVSKISRYFCMMVERQEKVQYMSPIARYLKLDPEFIPRNIIRMASLMAGLFHDIGYPETHLRSLQQRFAQYMPGLSSVHRRQVAIDDRFSLLQNSLLFRVVPLERVLDKVNASKVDHGTLSALTFLLHFYENGSIFTLEPYQAAAVELAALAIFNHTHKYIASDESPEKADDNKARFISNPIAYLLRVCDDLQEWDRVYFEISDQSNILICPRCQTSLVGKRIPDTRKPEKKTGGSGTEKAVGESVNAKHLAERHCYVCACSPDGNKQFHRAFDGEDAFYYRRIYNVIVCEEVTFAPLAPDKDASSWKMVSDLTACLNYEPSRLLHIAYINPGYASHRIRELNKLKPLLQCQVSLPRLWLDYFVTANPLLIKMKLMEQFLMKGDKVVLHALEDKSGIESYLDMELESFCEMTSSFKNSRWEAGIEVSDEKKKQITGAVDRALELYFHLFLYQMLSFRLKAERRPDGSIWESACECLKARISVRYPGSAEFRCLLGDALLQISRLYPQDALAGQIGFPDDYLCQFEPGNWKKELGEDGAASPNFYYTAVKRYVDPLRYHPEKINSRDINAFTDLGFFRILCQYLREPPNE